MDTRESRSGAIDVAIAIAPATGEVPPKTKKTEVAVTACVWLSNYMIQIYDSAY